MNLKDLNWQDGEDNTAGIQQNVYFAKLEDIATLPKPQVDDSTSSGELEQLVTISSNIVMKANKTFKKLYCTLEEGGLASALQGNMDGKSFKNTLEIFHPGSKAEVLGFAQWAKNSSLIIIVPESDGQARILGHAGYPAKMTGGGADTGKKTTDTKGVRFTFESVRKGPAPVFTGQIQLNIAGGSGAVDANSNSNQDIEFISGS